MKKPYKSKKVAFVCETTKGIAEYFDITPLRAVWLLLPGTFVIEIAATCIRAKKNKEGKK